ncbi:MAG TPA: hypothetical protein DEO65_00690 [Bacillus bacterium]|uniref:hypothetical protein n=1 Tax=Siminovitchia fordii TaxID=254759 RepID=UPI00037845CF|nr:hypothetical protein [Siminovitchia fordii]HBZ08383.1 hypothetical protein [Bacillus sp. (in: firmicutes)]
MGQVLKAGHQQCAAENAEAGSYLRKTAKIVGEWSIWTALSLQFVNRAWFRRDIDLAFHYTVSVSIPEKTLEKRIKNLWAFRTPVLSFFSKHFDSEN